MTGGTVTRVWRCTKCGHCAPWGPGWRWLGKLGEPDGPPEKVLCPKCPDDPGGLPYFD